MITGVHLDTCYYIISNTHTCRLYAGAIDVRKKLAVPGAFSKGQKIGFTATDYLNYTPWGRSYALHELVREFSNNVGG